MIICFFEAIYYNMFLSYSLIFFWDSWKDPLPWYIPGDSSNGVIWDSNYFYNDVLQKNQNEEGLGGFNWNVVLSTFVSYIILYLCIAKGIQSTGRVVYVTATAPYVLLTILLIRGLFLPGAGMGISYLFAVDWSKIWSFRIWIKAAG